MENIIRPRRPKKFNAAQVEQIRTRYLGGATTRQLAQEFDTTRILIGIILKGEYIPRED